MEKAIKKEIESLSQLIEFMEAGNVVGADANDLNVLSEKRDDLVKLSSLQMKMALVHAGVPLDLVLSDRQKKVFFKLVRIMLWYRRITGKKVK